MHGVVGRKLKNWPVWMRACMWYLRGAFEVHSRHRQRGDVHGDAAVQIERPHDEEEAPADD